MGVSSAFLCCSRTHFDLTPEGTFHRGFTSEGCLQNSHPILWAESYLHSYPPHAASTLTASPEESDSPVTVQPHVLSSVGGKVQALGAPPSFLTSSPAELPFCHLDSQDTALGPILTQRMIARSPVCGKSLPLPPFSAIITQPLQ